MTKFSELGLRPELVEAVAELGFENPTPIQEQAIPALLENPRDLVGLARTGTGKTAAFGLPLLHYIDTERKLPQTIVLCPTRELCLQIANDLKNFASKMKGVYILPVYGGSSISMQIKDLRRGVQVIVGTPGRVNDLIERGVMKLGEIETVVLDEADEMLNMGFREAIDTILAETPETKRTWLFSATMPEGVARIARSYMSEPLTVSVKGAQESDGKIDHFYCMVHARDKYPALRRIIDAHPDIYGIVFCRTKAETQDVADNLVRDGYMADSLHGDLSQAQRDHVMKRFRNRMLQVLVATDVAARGIDVDDITHVLHYQAPDEAEAYTHRSGRTGRAGKSGISILFLNAKETGRLREIERRTNRKLVYLPVPAGEDVVKNQILAFAIKLKNSESGAEVSDEYMTLLKEAMGEMTGEELLKKLMSLSLSKLLNDYAKAPDLNLQNKVKGAGTERREREERNFDEPEGEKNTFFFSIGRMDGVDPGALLRVVCDQLNLSRRFVGRIDLKHNFSFIEVIGVPPAKVLESFRGFKFQGRDIRVNQAENATGGNDRGWKKDPSDFEEKSSFSKKPYGEKPSFGKKSFGEKLSFARKSYGDKPAYGSKSSFSKKPFGKSFEDENPGRGFGAAKPGKSFGSKKKFGGPSEGSSEKSSGGDWKSLMNEPSGDRKSKFGKKKW
jgi:ATP-dependent RNA helicase DeaD